MPGCASRRRHAGAALLRGLILACALSIGSQSSEMDVADALPAWAKGEKAKAGGARARQMFLRKTDLKELELPIVRKAMRSPEGFYMYNATEDKWKPGVWKPIARLGCWGEYDAPADPTDHPALQRDDALPTDTLEDLVRRQPCLPPFCRKCPLRTKGSITPTSAAFYRRVTGKSLNISQAMRDPSSVPFFEALAYNLGGYVPNAPVEAHLDKLLLNAVEDADLPLASLLLKAGANVSAPHPHLFSPLHEAAFQGNVEMVELLIFGGASPETLDEYGRTPLHWAAFFGRLDACEALLCRMDARSGVGSSVQWVDAKDAQSDSPLILAFIAGHNPLASFFMRVRRKGLASACKLAGFFRRTLPPEHPFPRPSPIVPGLTHRAPEGTEDDDDEEEEGDEDDPMNEAQQTYAEAGELEMGPDVGGEADAVAAFEDATEQLMEWVRESEEAEDEKTRPPLEWGPGTDDPTPWQCFFCEGCFGSYDDAVEHENPCGDSHGWELRGQDGWCRKDGEQVFTVGGDSLMSTRATPQSLAGPDYSRAGPDHESGAAMDDTAPGGADNSRGGPG
eukprot:CAMPEP_0180349106 /NCGR_PEP_ID=MMETSP0989-20121125/5290_1 /TAXON_ID=697907 /ORGANISM="non described non described, Strain CCMP2293" /LENGTH=563 /DNA_ID=CAMNT_0022338403 /DNA_START=84 /DNA_END=1772 /DNA_ORIENTATION=-